MSEGITMVLVYTIDLHSITSTVNNAIRCSTVNNAIRKLPWIFRECYCCEYYLKFWGKYLCVLRKMTLGIG